MDNLDSLLSSQASAFSSPALRQITLEVERVGGVNLGQGVCNLPVPPQVLEGAEAAMREGINRYTNPRGLLSLRTAIANKLARHNGIAADPETEVLVTSGATGAFEAVCAMLLNPGDEVIVCEPSYPYHVQALRRYQANIRWLPLHAPDWEIDLDQLGSLLSPRTKFMLLNTPGNPTGKVVTREECIGIAAVLEGTRCLLVTDEIYEYMVFDGRKHVSPASLPELASRTLTIGGYSKTFSITGWRIGCLIAPPELASPLASLMDAVYVCAPAPLQEGVARALGVLGDDFYEGLRQKYEAKRDRFAQGLRDVGLEPLVPQGAYYMICGYEPGLSSTEFAARLISDAGVGSVPSTDFMRSGAPWVRFCLAHEDSVLEDALTRLGR